MPRSKYQTAGMPSLLYAYENTPAILPPDPEIAWTENEPPTQRQLTALLLPRAGARLPVLRCIARQWQAGRVLNVAHDGAVYFSSADWREAAH